MINTKLKGHALALVAFCFLTFSVAPSHAFFGMMKMMNPMNMMNPQQAMLDMCGTAAGKMGMGMMNMMSSMVPFGQSMKKSMMAGMSKRILMDPVSTLKAIDCAKRNSQAVTMLLESMQRRPQLLHYLGGAMIADGRVASSLMELVVNNYRVASYLFNHMNPLLFQQMSHAMYFWPQIVQPMVRAIRMYYQEEKFANRQSRSILQPQSAMMRSMMAWGSVENSNDGSEAAYERFLYAVFSDVVAANEFLDLLTDMENVEESYNSQDTLASVHLNASFLGKAPAVYLQDMKWVDVDYADQAHYNLYAVMKGLYLALVAEDNGRAKYYPPTVNEQKLKERLELGMMKYMLDASKRPTAWGMQFISTLVNGAMGHKDPEIAKFAEHLMTLMPPRFAKMMPPPDMSKPAPRDFIYADQPLVPQLRRR